ncbi:MAG TPA: c-type cytochrome, partial [Candidatus Saccharimonadales bacterium]|nr:c-type cytochrome [Candidatus Saccharimonadales bacterium]
FSADASLFLEDLGRVWARATPAGGRLACVEEILARTSDGLDHTMAALAGFAEESRASVRTTPGSPAGLRLQLVLAECRKSVGTGTAPVPERVRAVWLLGLHPPEANELLLERLRAGEPAELQLAMVRALTEPDNASGVRELLRSDRWPSYTPMLRGVLLSAVASRPEHQGALLDAIESGALPASSLDAERREQLRRAKDPDVQARAQRLLAAAAGGDRKKALDEAGACLALTPVPANGREVFKRVCAGCHRLDREGVAVGPDLFGIRNQPKETLLLHIVIPEQEIAPNYANYLCETRDGRTLSGLIVAETPASVTFRQAFGVEETISRGAMLSLTASRLSLMPQELERGMTRQELADLLAYLKGEE